jgi:hypothetical protein
MKKKFSLLMAALMLMLPFAACHPTGGETVHGSETDASSSTQSDTRTDTDTEIFDETEENARTEETSEEGEDYPEVRDTTVTIGGIPLSEFSVVRSADMPEGQITALSLFLDLLQRATQVSIPVITDDQSSEHEIIVGETARQNDAVEQACAEIRNDGYAIVVDGGDMYISATTGRGVVYGMFDLLENHLGVRLYTRDCVVVHSVGEVAWEEGTRIVFSPAFTARRTWIDNLYADPLDQVIYLKNNSDGLKKAKVGDTYPIRANSNHTIDDLAKVEGEAQVPCLTDEAVYAQVLKSVRKKLDNSPDQNVIQVGQGDGGQPCRCERCEAIHKAYGTDNATWFLFLNRLADECASLYPDRGVKLITYSYQYTHGVPGNGYTVSDNVIIDFCLDRACYNHALNDPDCPKNAPVAAELREWAKLCNADNLYVYEYAYNCGDKYLADPSLLVMWDNFRFYLECGVRGILSEGITANGGEFDHLRAYLLTRLTWNPHMTEEAYYALLDEFMADWYGEAAPTLREYMTILYDGKRITCTDMYTPMYTFFQTDAEEGSTSVNQEIMSQCQDLFDAALALDALSEEQRDRVEYTALHFMMVRYTYFPKGDRDEKKELFDKITELRHRYGI